MTTMYGLYSVSSMYLCFNLETCTDSYCRLYALLVWLMEFVVSVFSLFAQASIVFPLTLTRRGNEQLWKP